MATAIYPNEERRKPKYRRCAHCDKRINKRNARESDNGICKMCAGWKSTRWNWARKHGVTSGMITFKGFRELCAIYGDRCAACGCKPKSIRSLTVDHVIPLSRGGMHGWENIQPLCWMCNVYKWTDDTDFRPYAIQGIYLWADMPHVTSARISLLRRIRGTTE